MEEVDRVKSERDSLLDRVKQLDMRKQENPARGLLAHLDREIFVFLLSVIFTENILS